MYTLRRFIILLAVVYLCLCSANGCLLTVPKASVEIDGDVREVIGKLQHEKADVRLIGIAHLSAAPEKAVPAIPHLIRILSEGDALPLHGWYPWFLPPPAIPRPRPAKRASGLLVKIGKAAVPLLITALDDDNAILRGNAAWVLGQIGDPQAEEPVLKLLEDKDASVKRAVLRALGWPVNWKVEEKLRAVLNDGDNEFRGLAAVALGRRKDPQAVPALIKELEGKTSLLQDAAVWALGEIRTPKAMEALIAHLKVAPSRHVITVLGHTKEPCVVEPLIALLEHKDAQTQICAARNLGKIGDTRAVAPLITSLKDKRGRATSALALGKLGDTRAVPPLIDLLKDKRVEVQSSAATALGSLKARAAVEQLIALLNRDGDGRTACDSAVRALGEIGDKRAVEPLIDLLKQKKPYHFRFPVVFALGKLKDPRAVGPLIECLKDVKGNDPLTHRYGCSYIGYALKQIDDAKTAPKLERLMKSDNVYWRCAAIAAYGGMGAVDLTVKGLTNDNAKVRRMAAWELAEMGDTSAVPALKKLLSSEKDEQVVIVAKRALWTIELRNRRTSGRTSN